MECEHINSSLDSTSNQNFDNYVIFMCSLFWNIFKIQIHAKLLPLLPTWISNFIHKTF